MSENIKCTNLRFNTDNETHRKAWDYLQTMDKTIFKSYSCAVAVAVTEYFDRYYKLKEDPYFENRQREEEFITQIVTAVEGVLKETLPKFMLSCIAEFSNPPSCNL